MKALIDYLEGLTIGQGREAGQKMRLYPWQKRFIRGAFGQPDDAALSLARGAGKTTFVAGLAAAACNGPLVEPMGECLVVASSFDQGLICFRHILHFMGPEIEADTKRWRIQDSANRATITDRETGAMVRVLGSDPRRLHGAAPRLILADEVAQWPENQIDRMLAALETSRGKIPDSKMLWLGTRASSVDHPFEQAFKLVGYAQVHCAGPNDPMFRKATWRKSNPGIDRQPDLEKAIRQEAKRAKMDPSALARFKALRLNLGIPDVVEKVLLTVEAWDRIEVETAERAGEYVLGVDLGGSAAMSACSGYWPDTGALEAIACFPELPTLRERGHSDGVGPLYERLLERGELLQAGLRVSDIGALLTESLQRWGNPSAIVCDRWREAELRQTLELEEFPRCPIITRGQGYKDGADDVREFQKACLSDKVSPVRSMLLRSAMQGARVVTDPAGNAKLAKGGEGRRTRCRDDAAAAAILAVAEGRRRWRKGQRKRTPVRLYRA